MSDGGHDRRPELPAIGTVGGVVGGVVGGTAIGTVRGAAWWAGRRLDDAVFQVADGEVHGPPADPADADGPAQRLDGTILPGLRDWHVHALLASLPDHRAAGIASVVDLGGLGADLRELAAAARRPGSGLPRLAYAGSFLTAPDAYPSFRPWAAPGSCRAVASPNEAAEAVAEQLEAGATRIKAVVNTSVGPTTFDVATLTAIAQAAHAAGVELVTHAEGLDAVEIALEAGSDVFAHTPWTSRLPDAVIERAAAQTAWTSTIDIHGYGEPIPDRRTALDNLTRFVTAGGTVRYGTDLGNGPLPSGVNPREVSALLATGMGVDDVLAAMTDDALDVPVCWIPGGLPTDPAGLPAALTTARVLSTPVSGQAR